MRYLAIIALLLVGCEHEQPKTVAFTGSSTNCSYEPWVQGWLKHLPYDVEAWHCVEFHIRQETTDMQSLWFGKHSDSWRDGWSDGMWAICEDKPVDPCRAVTKEEYEAYLKEQSGEKLWI